MNVAAPGGAQPGNGLPDNLPVLTQVAGEDTLPTLTEVVPPDIEAPEAPPAAPGLNEDEIRRLLQQLDPYIEAIFTQKLNQHLEKLQRLAVRQAVSEFRATLPQLLRDMLAKPPGPRDGGA